MGHPDGLFLLGLAHQLGEGVEKNYISACEYWTMAAGMGHSQVRRSFLSSMFRNMLFDPGIFFSRRLFSWACVTTVVSESAKTGKGYNVSIFLNNLS
jgi:TPR repeat protein